MEAAVEGEGRVSKEEGVGVKSSGDSSGGKGAEMSEEGTKEDLKPVERVLTTRIRFLCLAMISLPLTLRLPWYPCLTL